MSERFDIFLVAGEASADLHGAALLENLRALVPGLTCYGVGGDALTRAGMEIVVDAKSLNVVGIADWFDKLGEVWGGYRRLCRLIKQRRPDCAILLDLPDLNLNLARKLKAQGVPVVYYISPQVWAWRKYRIRTIRKVVERMLVVFPFEKDFYQRNGVDVTFVGHPLLESLQAREGYRSPPEILAAPRVALLPGSRRSELHYHAPIIDEVARRIRARYPGARFQVPIASTLARSAVQESLKEEGLELIDGRSREVIAWADVAVVASGTATLETALIGTPFCLYYRISPSSAWIYHHLARYRGFIGMPNLLHGREVAREFFHEKATPEAIAAEALCLIEDSAYREQVARALRECRALLGQPGASARAAVQVAEVLRRRTHSSVAPSGAPLGNAPAHA